MIIKFQNTIISDVKSISYIKDTLFINMYSRYEIGYASEYKDKEGSEIIYKVCYFLTINNEIIRETRSFEEIKLPKLIDEIFKRISLHPNLPIEIDTNTLKLVSIPIDVLSKTQLSRYSNRLKPINHRFGTLNLNEENLITNK